MQSQKQQEKDMHTTYAREPTRIPNAVMLEVRAVSPQHIQSKLKAQHEEAGLLLIPKRNRITWLEVKALSAPHLSSLLSRVPQATHVEVTVFIDLVIDFTTPFKK